MAATITGKMLHQWYLQIPRDEEILWSHKTWERLQQYERDAYEFVAARVNEYLANQNEQQLSFWDLTKN